ncbi:uncharacterized protein LOC115630719 [Scaptodrosophila lebanonensis]|uniref:Uncharacterized protein LOC115630719 n=1 Tax=Drosophila lebanonensis TaxID=7225 RepID=A0A6J2U3M1_DROLE|nr:uncharacterized protein LOC115630719 [Scaptodrosophila lebanonensis]
MDIAQLINEVIKRQALWDTQTSTSSRQGLCALLWKEVAEAMNSDVELCEKGFRSLRHLYRCEIRKLQNRVVAKSQWPHFQSMEFLRRIYDPEQLVPFPPQQNSSQSDSLDGFIVDVSSDDTLAFDVSVDMFKSRFPKTSGPKQLTVNTRPWITVDLTLDTENPSPAISRVPTLDEVCDMDFLKGLLPIVKSLSEEKKQIFRNKVVRLLKRLQSFEKERASVNGTEVN